MGLVYNGHGIQYRPDPPPPSRIHSNPHPVTEANPVQVHPGGSIDLFDTPPGGEGDINHSGAPPIIEGGGVMPHPDAAPGGFHPHPDPFPAGGHLVSTGPVHPQGELQHRRALLQVAALLRARQGLGGTATNRRLASLNGLEPANVQNLSQTSFQTALKMLLSSRARARGPGAARYDSLF